MCSRPGKSSSRSTRTNWLVKTKDKQKYYEAIERAPDYPKPEHEQDKSSSRQFANAFIFPEGALFAFTQDPLTEETSQILRRFASVFALTYRRFLDLQKAEAQAHEAQIEAAQAREAQIEAALERVRACTMAMHQSEELQEVIRVVFEQLESLNLDIDASNINVHLKDSKDHYMWTAATSQRYDRRVHLPYFNHPFFTRYETALHNGEALLTDTMTFEEKNSFFVHFYTHAEFTVPKKRKAYIAAAKGIARSTVLSKDTSLTIWNYKVVPYTPDENGIIKRFAQVFEQTYTRFLDLQKAETQAREAKIEASLERVRAKAMAMQSSDELRSVVAAVFKELQLSIDSQICILLIFNLEKDEFEWWSTGMSIDILPESYKIPIREEVKDHPLIKHYLDALQKGVKYSVFELSGETKKSIDKYFFTF